MPRHKKDAKALNCKTESSIYEMIESFCTDVGQSKTVFIERATKEYVQNHRKEQRKLREIFDEKES